VGGLTALSFTGSGAGLFNLNPASLSAGLAGININGNAATATTAASATNAAALGGVAAASFARLDINNTFAGNQSVNGTVTIGSGGTAITEHVSILENPKFPALKTGVCASANFTLTGAADGDTIALGVPNERMTGGGILIYTAWVSASNQVTLQGCNVGTSQKSAGTGSIRIDLWKH